MGKRRRYYETVGGIARRNHGMKPHLCWTKTLSILVANFLHPFRGRKYLEIFTNMHHFRRLFRRRIHRSPRAVDSRNPRLLLFALLLFHLVSDHVYFINPDLNLHPLCPTAIP